MTAPLTDLDVAAVVRDISARIDEVTDRAPWSRLSREDRVDHLPPLLTALITPLTTDQVGANERLLEEAYTHGTHRREQQMSEEILLDEYYILRDQAYRALRTGRSMETAIALTYRLDPAITEATVASLLGFHGAGRDRIPAARPLPATTLGVATREAEAR